jgi:DNA-binding GntR family transcriptional regulator
MSTIPGPAEPRSLTPLSVVGLAYDEIRRLIVSRPLPPGTRLGQQELAEALGISRGSVREALLRLSGEGIVEFQTNRGFFVGDLGITNVLLRLEVRSLLEPLIARLAAERITLDDLAALERHVESERGARTSEEAHDASRDFHLSLARATNNEELVRVLDSLWIPDVGRRLLASRTSQPTWQQSDADEHEQLLRALKDGNAARAEDLMRRHIGDALRYWAGPATGPNGE